MGYAVLAGDLARVRLLLSLGADPDEAWGTGTPLLQVVDEPLEFFDQRELRIARHCSAQAQQSMLATPKVRLHSISSLNART